MAIGERVSNLFSIRVRDGTVTELLHTVKVRMPPLRVRSCLRPATGVTRRLGNHEEVGSHSLSRLVELPAIAMAKLPVLYDPTLYATCRTTRIG
jgi:hypothetical protein